LQIEGGAGYERERRLASPVLSFASVQSRVFYRWQVSPLLAFDDEGAVSADPGDRGNWRGSNKASATVSLNRSLALRVSHTLEFLNQPVPGFRQADTVTSVGLLINLRR
jgi:putative salt-induced outer membrane protein YdiY